MRRARLVESGRVTAAASQPRTPTRRVAILRGYVRPRASISSFRAVRSLLRAPSCLYSAAINTTHARRFAVALTPAERSAEVAQRSTVMRTTYSRSGSTKALGSGDRRRRESRFSATIAPEVKELAPACLWWSRCLVRVRFPPAFQTRASTRARLEPAPSVLRSSAAMHWGAMQPLAPIPSRRQEERPPSAAGFPHGRSRYRTAGHRECRQELSVSRSWGGRRG